MVTVRSDLADTPATISTRPARLRAGRLWWLVHHWAGLKFSILTSFILLTGTLATLAHDMDWAMRPAMRVDPASVSGPVAWPAIAANVAALGPDVRIQSIEAPLEPWFAAIVTIERGGAGASFVYAHPSSGAVQGEGPWVGAHRVLRNMHRHLNMPVAIGVPIVSALSLLLLVSLVSALVVYKRWWAGFLRPIRLRDARLALGDLHRLAGLWSLWFVALMIATGLWYLAEATIAPAPALPSAKAAPVALESEALASALARSLATAKAVNPDLRIQYVRFPTDKSGAFQFHGQDRALLVRPRANAVWTDAATGQALLVVDGRDLSAHQRISEAADPLHFGTFGGFATRLIWFAFGLALTALSVSGVMICALRLARPSCGAVRREGQASLAALAAWRAMGRWRWLALALTLLGFALLPQLFTSGGT